MTKHIKQNLSKIITIFILLQPILDLITGLCVHTLEINFTLGIIIRVLFLAFIMLITTFVYKKKFAIYSYLALSLYSILYLVGIIIYKDGGLFHELQGLLKAIYFPIILISLYELKDEFKISKMTLFTVLITYLLCILIPNTLNVGFDSYKVTKSGSLGFFNAANEISGIISILTPIMFIIIKELKNKILKVLFALIYLIVILTIGTKTPLLTLIITTGFTFLYYMAHCIKKKTYKPILFSGLAIIAAASALLIVLPKTNFYKNIKVHLEFLEVENIMDVFKEKELIDHFIFSQRLSFMEDRANDYINSSAYEKLFGIGYTENKKQAKLIEMDYFDNFYNHGIIGFLVLTGLYFTVLYKVIMNSKTKSYESYMIKVSIFLILLLSFFTGHIITAPAVSMIAVALILGNIKHKKKDLLFATVHFDMGGIETSLINLLNQVNYDKYNATVVLEEKRGVLLDTVNKNVNIQEVKVSNHPNKIIRKATNLARKLIYTIFNYNKYDFSCCYATYSLSSNKLAKTASKNNSIYVHSDYTILYENKEDFYKFFNDRKVSDFRKILFVTNESRDNFIKEYKNLKGKCEVYATFTDVDMVITKSKEKITAKKPKNKTLFVFVGRLEDHSKKVSRAINLVKNIENTALWIIGDGPDRKMYEDLVKKEKLEKDVTFFGMQTNPYPYIKEADYVVLTSDYEGFALIYQEAMVLNRPIIGTVNVSDSQMDIGRDYAHIVTKDEKKMITEVKKILSSKEKQKEIDYKKIQIKRFENLEKLFNEVI